MDTAEFVGKFTYMNGIFKDNGREILKAVYNIKYNSKTKACLNQIPSEKKLLKPNPF